MHTIRLRSHKCKFVKVCEPHPLKFTTGQSPDRRLARRLINYVARRNQERGGNDPSPANADGPDDGPLSVTRRPARRVLVRPLSHSCNNAHSSELCNVVHNIQPMLISMFYHRMIKHNICRADIP